MKKNELSALIRSKNLWMWVGVAVLAVIAIAGAVFLLPSGGALTITPTLSRAAGELEPDTAFIVTAPKSMTKEKLREAISFTPGASYKLEAQEEGGYILTPTRPLKAGSSVTIKCGGRSTTYAVAKTLLVTSTMPLDGSRGVNTHAGIEMVFNQENVYLADFKSAFTISPQVAGEFYEGDGRLTFAVGDEGMEYGTKYTVTLNPPLTTPSGFALREPVSFSFTAITQLEEATEYLFNIDHGDSALNALSDEAPQVRIYLDEQITQPEIPNIDVKLYKYDSVDDYMAQAEKTDGYDKGGSGSSIIDVSGLTESDSFTAVPFARDSEVGGKGRSEYVLAFPEPLPTGHYAVEYSVLTSQKDLDGKPYVIKRYQLIQSTDLSVFFMQTGDDLLLWVNDVITGAPVNGAQFDLTGDIVVSTTTGTDGTALVHSEGMSVKDWRNNHGVFTVITGDKVFVDTQTFAADGDTQSAAQSYVSYLFTDRPIYRTSDTIKMWGMVRPRSDKAKLPDELTVTMDGADPIKVKPNAKGLFTAELSYTNMTASWNNVRLKLDEETTLSEVFIMIQDYVKPVYVATSAPTKPVYMVGQGETPAVNVDISLFDGTPVPNFEGRVSSWDNDNVKFEWNGKRLGENEHIRADAAGRVALSLAIENKENGWYPKAYNYMFTNADGENQTLYEAGNVNLIWRDLMLVGKPKLGDGTAEVTINTNRIDISKIKTGDDLNNINLLKGAPVTAEVTATLVRHYYNKIEKGTGYDFVNRVSVPIYDYQPAKETVEHYTVTTRGGTATIKDIPCKVTDNDGYTLELRAMDSLGRTTDYSVSLTPWSEYWRGEADQRYNLCKQVPLKDRKMVENSRGMEYADDWQTLYRFVDDEEVTFELLCNDKPVSKMKGKILSAVVQNSVSHVTLTDKATVTLPYSEELLPDYAMVGAYFDGRHAFPISPTNMQFDPEKRELDIKIKGDKATYAPADPVKLSVTVTNKVTGKPAADAEVVVAVVDEAIFAMRGQNTALLYEIYREVYYPAITQYSSYSASGYYGGAEKGGGGGDQVRKDFQDTAFFGTAKTDAKGKTSFSFTMPDNITAWRATGLALTDDNQAGDSKEALVATKKFFVTPVVHETILAGDSFTVGLRSAGTGVSSEAPVSYTVTVKGDGYEKEQTIKSKLREYAPLTFDGLPVGDYTVTVRGSSHGGSDTLQMPFSVIPSGLEVSLHQTFNLAEGIKIDPLRSPVRIEVYNKAYRTYNRVLQNLADNCYGMRADMRIANKYVAQRMEKDGYWYQKSADVDISDLIAILHPLPNSAGDIDLTARLMLALPGMLDLQSVSNLSPENLEGVVGSETSFYLVKALDKKVDATEIKERLAINPDYSFVEKLTMSTALAVLGDTKTAEASYEELVTPRLNKLVGISGEEALYIKDEIDGRTGADCTAAASMLATVLGNKDAEPLMRYLVEKPSQYEPYIAEQLLFLTRFDPKDNTETKLSYTKDGTVKTETVGSRGLRLSLSKKQLSEVNFKVLSGEAYGDVYYTGDILQNNDSVNKKLGITKTITPMEDTLSTGRLVKITLTPDLSGLDRAVGDAQLLVEDYIPSGMCFEEYRPENPFDKANIWWRRGINGQRLRFSCVANQKMNPIVYYVRCNTPGDYVVESAYIASENGKTWGISPRDKVTILSDPAAPKAETTE